MKNQSKLRYRTFQLRFAQLQMNTCLELGIIVPGTRNSPEEVAAMQLIGASAGEIISPSNAIISKILINSNKV